MFYLSVQCHYVIKHIGHKNKVSDHERKSVAPLYISYSMVLHIIRADILRVA